MEKNDIIPVHLDGKNYMGWSFHLKHFVKGQGLRGYLDRTTTEPTNVKDVTSKATWDQNNSKVVAWILNSIEPSIALSLHSFSTEHLRKLYHQNNKACEFYLDTQLGKYCQGERTVQEYFSEFLTL